MTDPIPTPTPPVPVGPPTPITPRDDIDVLVNLRTHINNLTLDQLKQFTEDLSTRVDTIHTTVPPDSGPASSNADISRIETALKLARAIQQRRETQAAPLPLGTATLITDTIAILDQIDKAP